ncbi:peroxisomal assembly protein [Komagataella kurtzmanii]|nr:peroxisomal assembly protein [Komagataella kurtzmanii]
MPGITETNQVTGPVLVHVIVTEDPYDASERAFLSTDLYELLFEDYANGSKSGLTLISIQLMGSSLFNEFQTFKVYESEQQLPPNTVNLCNMGNIIDYSSDFTVDSGYVARVDSLVKLDTVIISVLPEVYNLASQASQQQLVDILGGNDQHTVIRQGDYNKDINGKISLCEPTDQGFLESTTKIIVVKENSLNLPLLDQSQDGSLNYEENVKMNLEHSISNYFSLNSLDPENQITTTGVAFSVKCLDSSISLRKTAKSISVAHDSEDESSPKLVEEDISNEDTLLYAFCKTTELAKIGCLSGDIVKMKSGQCQCTTFECNCESCPVQYRYIRIHAFTDPNTYEKGCIYLNPILSFNLNNPKIVKLCPISIPDKRFELQAFHFSKFIPLAKQVTIARVSSPVTLDRTLQTLFLTNLKTYFESGRKVLSKDQLIPIPVDTLLAKSIFSTYEKLGVDDSQFPAVIPEGKPDAIAWFKVTEVSGELADSASQQFIIDPLKTKMMQSGVVSCSPPKNSQHCNWANYLGCGQMFSFPNVSGVTSSTFEYAKTLRKLIKATIDPSRLVNLQTTVLLSSLSRAIGKSLLVHSLALECGVHLVEIDGYEVLNPSSESKTIGTIRGKLDRVVEGCTPLIVFIRHIEALTKKSEQQQKDSLAIKINELIDEYTAKPGVLFVASTNDSDNLSDELRAKFKFEIVLGVPSEQERTLIFKYLIDFDQKTTPKVTEGTSELSFAPRNDLSLSSLSLQSAGLTPRDLISIVEHAKTLAVDRVESLAKHHNVSFENMVYSSGGYIKFTPEDVEKSINTARNKFSDSIGAPRIPNVKWEDVGGLDVVKDEILDTIDMPMKHPELFSNGIKKRSGILFYGPPGTGKTLLAKAIATNFALNFFSVKGPELLNMYIGESEANVRKVFQRARDAKPCVVFFDELDSVAPKRGNQGDSGGVMDRIVSQLLAELDGMSGGDGGDGVFVVGATNRPDLLDEALLRPGRFDKMLYLGVSDTHEKQSKIMEALSRKFHLHPSVDLDKVAESCPFTFTGADFYALCSDAMLNAMTRIANTVDEKIKRYNEELPEKSQVSTRWWFDNVATKEDIDVLVTLEDFDKSRKELVPSVSAEELDHYLRVRQNFEGGKEKKVAQENGQTEHFSNGSANNHITFGDEQVVEAIDENGNSIIA